MLRVDGQPTNGGGVIPPLPCSFEYPNGCRFPPTPLSEQGRVFVRRCVDVLIRVCGVYGFDPDGYHLKGTYDHWIYCAAVDGDPLRFVKWKISAYFAHNISYFAETQEMPSSVVSESGIDNGHCILGGKAYKWLNMLRNKSPLVFREILISILYSKKGMPRPTNRELKEAERQTFLKLTAPIPRYVPLNVPWSRIDAFHDKVETILSRDNLVLQIRRTVRELLPPGKFSYTDEDRFRPFVPSTSANYINSRNKGGSVETIRPFLKKYRHSVDDLIKLKTLHVKDGYVTLVDKDALVSTFGMLYKDVLKAAIYEEQPFAIPLALPEALKKRVITKGPGLMAMALKPLQRKMWSVLKQNKVFSLIGEPVTVDYLQQQLGRKLREHEYFVSIDYSDATNDLASFCSEVVAEEIGLALDLSVEESMLLTRSLTEHVIRYLKESAPQTRGQLMGSISSFYVLCIINATICRWSLEIDCGKPLTLNRCKLAVNGDDGLFISTDQGYNAWKQIAALAGLSPSIGKVYKSRKYLNINSTSFFFHTDGYESRIHENNRLIHYELVQYVNMGLLLGLKRSGERGDDERDDIATRAQQLFATSPAYLHEKILSILIHTDLAKGKYIEGCKQYSQLLQYNLPWFIPKNLGGVGLPIVGRFKPSNADLRVARKIYENNLSDIRMIPAKTHWYFWEYAQQRFRLPQSVVMSSYENVGSFVMPNQEQPITLSQLRALFCVESLFTERVLYNDQERRLDRLYKKRILSTLSGNERIWKKARLSSVYPEPFHIDRFPTIYNTNDVPCIFPVHGLHQL